MEKDIFLKDYIVSRIISFGKDVDGYGKVYYKTNEDLIDPYIDIDFKDKDVLTVLGSSDQVFTARTLEAKKTDAFDYNRLSYYYFFLRIWAIKYRKVLYPLIMDGNNNWLKALLREVIPTTEEEKKAYEFFKKHVKEDTEIDKLFYDLYAQPQGRALFTKAEELRDCIDPHLNFYQLDLFKDFYLQATYDIIMISNILEWARKDPKKLEIAHQNLARLVNDNGVVICSKLLYSTKKETEAEIDVFKDDFDYEKTESGYLYIKKH